MTGLLTAAHVMTCAALFFTLMLLCGLWRLRRRPAPAPPRTWPPLALLRPCEGAEPELQQNLMSSLHAHYGGPRRVLFLIPDRADPAYAVAAAVVQAAAAEGRADAAVVLTAPAPRQNRKVAQLVAGLQRCAEELVVVIDSDVRLGDADLPALVAALEADPRNAAAFAAPVEVAPRTPWDRASAALVGGSPQSFLALYGLYGLLGGVPSMAGALCALRRQALVRGGGFAGLLTFLGEDYELARRFTALGYRIALSREPARCSDGGRSPGEVIARVARWLTVVRSQRPLLLLTYPVFVAPTPALLLAAALWWRSPLWLYVAALLAARALLCAALRRAQGLGRGPLAALGEVLGAELLLWAGLGRALATRRIRWRGHRFRIGRGGRMLPDDPPPGRASPAASAPPPDDEQATPQDDAPRPRPPTPS